MTSFRVSIRAAALAALAAAAAALPAAAAAKAAYRHFLKAILLQQRGELAAALQEFEAAAQLDPASSYILQQAAQLAVESGQPARALGFARRLAALEPSSAKARLLLGNVHWAMGDAGRARAAFEEALKLDPRHGDALYALGGLLSTESPAKAREYFERYLAANPENPAEGHYQVALMAERSGKPDDAVEHLKAAAALDPSFVAARYALAQLYEVRRDTAAVLGEFIAILERDPRNVGLLNRVGELYAGVGDPALAEAYFLRAQAVQPSSPASCFWLAVLAEQKGDFLAAARHLSASSASEESPEIMLRTSYYLSQADKAAEAMAVLEKGARKFPESVELAYFLALGYQDAKNDDKAIKTLRRLLEREPGHRDARFQLAAIYERTGKVADMEREFSALIERRPNDASALNYLGYSLTDRGLKLEEAESFIRRAVALEPANAAYRDSLGWSHFKQGRFAEALAELRTAAGSTPEDATVLDHLGDALKAAGDLPAAWEAWKRSLAFDAANAKARQKVEEAEAGFSPAELGARLLAYLRRVHGRFEAYGGVCGIEVVAGRATFSYKGLLSYRADGPLRVEVLGPLFVPVMRAELSADGGFSMDPLAVAGVPPEAVQETLYAGLAMLKDLLSGAAFDGEAAALKKGWKGASLQTPSRELALSGDRSRLESFQPSAGAMRLALDASVWREGRAVPTGVTLKGRGFSVVIKVPAPTARQLGAP